MPDSTIEHLADRAVERTVAGRRAEYGAEMRRIVDTTFLLVEDQGSLEPSMREILAAAGLSTQAFYKYFSSKDELMLALLDEGRRRLVDTLERRMARASTPADRIQAWVEGVLAQSVNTGAAARTRPWVLNEQRLADLFPDQHQASVDLLVGLLHKPVAGMRRKKTNGDAVIGLATLVYQLTFATLRTHLVARTKPRAAEVELLVAFCLRGVTP